LLIAEADPARRKALHGAASVFVDVHAVADFQAAYARMTRNAPDLLVANLRLNGTVEGLQLAYVVASSGYPTRVLVYGDRVVPWIMRELHRAGAFFEAGSRVEFALPAFVNADLPVLDRRNPVTPDRRSTYRGGRRASDVPAGRRG
jgi:hypothetical protein